MSKREYRRFTADQKIEILREGGAAWRHGKRGVQAAWPVAVSFVSLTGGGSRRIGSGIEARCATSSAQG